MEPELRHPPVYFYEIDLLRFLAALAVVFYHYTYRGFNEGSLSPLAFPELGRYTKYGYLGVPLFFIISGYVVLLSAQGKTVRQFFLSRLTRLYPAFWVACTLTFLVERTWGASPADLHMPSTLHAGPAQYVYNMSMMPEFLGIGLLDGAYWSLTIEITFYFLIACLIGFKLLRYVDGCLAAWLLYCALPNLDDTNAGFAILFFPRYGPLFAAGMLFYLLQQPGGRSWQRYALLLFAYLLAVKNALVVVKEYSAMFHDAFSRPVVVATLTSFFLIFCLIAFRWLRLSRFPGLAWWGSLTYPLYLLHTNIGFVLFHRLQHVANKYVLVGGTILLMLFAARLMHVYVEKPLGKALGAWAKKWLAHLDYASAGAA